MYIYSNSIKKWLKQIEFVRKVILLYFSHFLSLKTMTHLGPCFTY